MEIIPTVHRVEGITGANVYLLVGDKLSLIDTGFPGNGDRILAYIRKIGREPKDLNHIILTHNHIDHAGSAAELQALTEAKILAHPADAEIVKGEGTVILSTHRHMPGWMLRKLQAPARVNQFVTDGDIIPSSGSLYIVHTPGHTQGSICPFLWEKKVLFTGDIILNNGNRLSRPLPHHGVNPEQAEESLRKIAKLDVEVCCFSHGEPILERASAKIRQLVTSPSTTPIWWRVIRNLGSLTNFLLRLRGKRA